MQPQFYQETPIMSVVLRFAPSPTGRLHIGNARTALLNWLYARKMGGRFILRLDDTDQQRSSEDYAQGIRDDLNWLGLDWDLEERQSARFARYEEIIKQLRAAGRLYPCFESEDELARKRRRQRASGRPPVYDRAALKLSASDIKALQDDGQRPHWRFLLDRSGLDRGADGKSASKASVQAQVHWKDLIRGEQSVDLSSLSDPVLIREDGSYLYTLCSVIDDIDFAVSHVMRGEDHVTNTAVQIQIFEALGARAPEFAHHSLLVGSDGKGLSKRLGSLSIEGFRDMGLEPMAVACHAALIGTSDAVRPYYDPGELADLFAFSKLSRAPGRFDLEELKALNGKMLHQMPFALACPRLAEMGIAPADGDDNTIEAFWQAVQGNLKVFSDARYWWDVVSGGIKPVIEEAEFCAAAADLLPPEPWDDATWGGWTATLKSDSGKKGRALFHPLRLALTGRDNGPELKTLLPLIGRDLAARRLRGEGG